MEMKTHFDTCQERQSLFKINAFERFSRVAARASAWSQTERESRRMPDLSWCLSYQPWRAVNRPPEVCDACDHSLSHFLCLHQSRSGLCLSPSALGLRPSHPPSLHSFSLSFSALPFALLLADLLSAAVACSALTSAADTPKKLSARQLMTASANGSYS